MELILSMILIALLAVVFAPFCLTIVPDDKQPDLRSTADRLVRCRAKSDPRT